MDIVKIVLKKCCCKELIDLGLKQGREYYAYTNSTSTMVEFDGLVIQLKENDFVITETTNEISAKVQKAKLDGAFIKLIN